MCVCVCVGVHMDVAISGPVTAYLAAATRVCRDKRYRVSGSTRGEQC